MAASSPSIDQGPALRIDVESNKTCAKAGLGT